MGKKDLIRIINEEISEFDFLGNDERQKEEEVFNILKNEDLQKQFICDKLLGRGNIKQIEVSDAWLGGDWEAPHYDLDSVDKLNIEYDVKLTYTYDQSKPPIEFNVFFKSDNIYVSMGGWYDPGRFGGTPDTDIEPTGDRWFDSINYSDIDVTLFTTEGDEIEFTAFEKAPDEIKYLFIRDFIEPYIIDYTNLEVRDKPKFNIHNVPYC